MFFCLRRGGSTRSSWSVDLDFIRIRLLELAYMGCRCDDRTTLIKQRQVQATVRQPTWEQMFVYLFVSFIFVCYRGGIQRGLPGQSTRMLFRIRFLESAVKLHVCIVYWIEVN